MAAGTEFACGPRMPLTFASPGPVKLHSTRRRRRGFTLLELLVVLVVLGLLVSIVGPRYFAQLGKSEGKAAQAQIASIAKALDLYRIDVGRYPTSEQGLPALTTPPPNEPRWRGPYLQKPAPPDPWARPYVYKSPGEQGADFDLLSLGKDGTVGGTDENADVSY
jgi:general secretion pathway protein G